MVLRLQQFDDDGARGAAASGWRWATSDSVSFGLDGMAIPEGASAAPDLVAPQASWTLGLPGEDDLSALAEKAPIVCYGKPNEDLALVTGSMDDGWVFGG